MYISDCPRRKLFEFINPYGIATFLVIVVPWCFAAEMQLPGFLREHFINEQLLRFFNARLPHDYHNGPIFFYLPRICIYLFPWSLLLPTLFKKIHGRLTAQDPLKIFSWLIVLTALTILSLSGAKGDYYMVVAMPFLAFLLGLKIDEYLQGNNHKVLKNIFGITGIMVLSALFVLIARNVLPTAMQLFLYEIALYLVLYIGGGYFVSVRTKNPLTTFLLLAGMIFPITLTYIKLENTTSNTYSQVAIAQYIAQHDVKRDIYLFQDFENLSSFSFYTQKPLAIIETDSKDLYFGSKHSATRNVFLSGTKFKKLAKAKPIYLLLPKSRQNSFANILDTNMFCRVTQNAKVLLLSNKKEDCV
jgi:hypothetical protein